MKYRINYHAKNMESSIEIEARTRWEIMTIYNGFIEQLVDKATFEYCTLQKIED